MLSVPLRVVLGMRHVLSLNCALRAVWGNRVRDDWRYCSRQAKSELLRNTVHVHHPFDFTPINSAASLALDWHVSQSLDLLKNCTQTTLEVVAQK